MDEGFTVNSYKTRLQNICLAFSEFKEKFGDYLVTENFQIPKDDTSWSENVRGIDLGNILFKMRHNRLHFTIHPQLTAMGVDLSTTVSVDRSINIVLFKKYNEIYGNLKIPKDFIVPHDNEKWPQIYWYYEFGAYVQAIRADLIRNSHKYRKEDIDVLENWGFGVGYSYQFARSFSGLEAYKKLHGSLEVPKIFKIQHGDVNYPKETWGLLLGKVVYRLKHNSNLHANNRQKLLDLGFDFTHTHINCSFRYEFDEVYSALEAYKRVNGNLIISPKFVIPIEGDENYASEVRGMRLGEKCVYCIV
jgi:hypothetical protein